MRMAMNGLTWFAVTFEHEATGLRFTEYRQAMFPTEAAVNPPPGWIHVQTRVHGTNRRWPNLPDYQGC